MSFIANLLTILRIIAIPFILWGFFMQDRVYGAKFVLALFIAASITDYLDGKIARMSGTISKFGQMLDPIADKLLVTCVLIMLVYDRVGNAPRADLIPVLIIISREIFVSGLREFLALERIAMPVTGLAKWKTTFQFLAILCLLAVPLFQGFMIKGNYFDMHQSGQILLWIAAFFTFLTGSQYFKHTLREGFKDRKLLQIKFQSADERQ